MKLWEHSFAATRGPGLKEVTTRSAGRGANKGWDAAGTQRGRWCGSKGYTEGLAAASAEPRIQAGKGHQDTRLDQT